MSFSPRLNPRSSRRSVVVGAHDTHASPPIRIENRGLRIAVSPMAIACLLAIASATTASESQSDSPPAASPNGAIALSNCNDSGPGSLRDAVASAASGDTIVLRPSGCNHIRLTSGPILLDQDDLTLIGPGPDRLLVSGNRTRQVLVHNTAGTLRIKGMSIGYGRKRGGNVRGGCIETYGNLQLKQVQVHHCVAEGGDDPSPETTGGGIFAAGDVSLVDTVIRDNLSDSIGEAKRGGLDVGGRLTMVRSQIRNNVASGYGSLYGGASAGSMHAYYSEISGNQAYDFGGLATDEAVLSHSSVINNVALDQVGGAVFGGKVLIVDSTISRNSATTEGGLFLVGDATLANSTVAFNRELTTHPGACKGGLNYVTSLHLESTIVARNSCNGGPLDITAPPHSPPPIVGANNLVEFSTVPLPPDTISANPELMPLANNGGPTRTHTLGRGSPAIDRGNNILGLDFDQRGQGFPRVQGASADIGASELPTSP